MKFGRTYKALVHGRNQRKPHEIAFPITCAFNIDRQLFAQRIEANFSFHGLGATSRNDIYYDRLTISKDLNIVFSAGYSSQSKLHRAFSGNIKTAYTERVGSDLITKVTARDGGFGALNGSGTFRTGKNWNFESTIKKVINKIPGIVAGTVKITGHAKTMEREVVFNGNWMQELEKHRPDGSRFFIDNGVGNLLGEDDVLNVYTGAKMQIISSSSGLLNIPKVYGKIVEVPLIFDPTYKIGQEVKLNSRYNANANKGSYIVKGVRHHGVISGAVSGDAFTDLTLMKRPNK